MPKPKRWSSSRSFLPYSGPRVPMWLMASVSRMPSSTARRNGRAVGVFGAEVGVPGVQVRVEVQHGDGPPARSAAARSSGRAMVWSPPRVTSLLPVGGQVQGVLLDRLDGLVDVERVHGHVAGVGHLDVLERADVPGRVVRAQQPAGLADVVGAEAGAGAVGDAGVEGHADHRDVGLGHLVQPGQPGDRWRLRRSAGCGMNRWGQGCHWPRCAALPKERLSFED